MKSNYRIGLVALVLSAALGATGAAQQPATQKPETKAKQTKAPAMTMPALTDADFVEIMTRHQQEGIELAKLEESRGTRDEVKALAAKIREGQERELDELKTAQAGRAEKPAPGTEEPRGTSGRAGYSERMQKHQERMERRSAEARQKIETASGPAVDEAFLREMARHNREGLNMIARAKLTDPNLRKLSQQIAEDDKRELGELKKLQKGQKG